MKNKQEWFETKVEKVSPEIMAEVQLSASIVARIDKILKEKKCRSVIWLIRLEKTKLWYRVGLQDFLISPCVHFPKYPKHLASRSSN